MLSLLAAAGAGAASVAYVRPSWAFSPLAQIVADGNSLAYGYGCSMGLLARIIERVGILRAGATWASVAVNGQRWADMVSDDSDVLAALDDAVPQQALLLLETTNQIRLGMRGGQTQAEAAAETISQSTAYISAVRSAHPRAVIGLLPAPPAGKGDLAETGDPDYASENAAISAVNAHMAANWGEMGAHGWCDYRSAIPQFDHDGSSAAFSAFQSWWAEAPPSTGIWPTSGWVHWTDGLWPEDDPAHPMGTGQRAVASFVADWLLSGGLPELP